MPAMHLRQPRFSYSDCRPFTKNKQRIQKFKEDSKYTAYHNELDKAFFQLDIVLTVILKICQKEDHLIKYYMIRYLTLLKVQNNNGYQRCLASIINEFFDVCCC